MLLRRKSHVWDNGRRFCARTEIQLATGYRISRPGNCADAPVARRQFVKGLVGLATAPLLPLPALATISSVAERRLSFAHTHTGEKLAVVYRSGDEYAIDALRQVNHHLRDHRSGESYEMDTALLDLLHQLATVTGSREPFQVISGYRSPGTNAMLRKKGNGVAKRSLHMQGRAIDVRLADVPTSELRRAAIDLRAGGVGFYPKSDFVHLDTGRFRTW